MTKEIAKEIAKEMTFKNPHSKKGIIERVGPTKNGYWRVIRNL
jgi:hypothetical protein